MLRVDTPADGPMLQLGACSNVEGQRRWREVRVAWRGGSGSQVGRVVVAEQLHEALQAARRTLRTQHRAAACRERVSESLGDMQGQRE